MAFGEEDSSGESILVSVAHTPYSKFLTTGLIV
jgi:hypothetical protein